jgi:hypothetical protein
MFCFFYIFLTNIIKNFQDYVGERDRKQWYGGILDVRNAINSIGSFQNILFYLRFWEKKFRVFCRDTLSGNGCPFPGYIQYTGGPQSRETVPLILAFSTNDTSFYLRKINILSTVIMQ